MLNNLEDMQPDYEMLDRVFAQGINTFDNAHVYGGGRSDVIFGNWVQKRGIRDQLVIIGKGSHHNEFRKRVTPFDLEADIADTLARMQFLRSICGCFTETIHSKLLAPLLRLANGPSMLATYQHGG